MPLLCLSKSQDTEAMESLHFRLVVLLFVHFGLPGKTERSKASYTNLFSILLANRVFQIFLGRFTKTVNFTFPQCYLLIKMNRRAATNALLMSLYFLKKKILNTFGYVIFSRCRMQVLPCLKFTTLAFPRNDNRSSRSCSKSHKI